MDVSNGNNLVTHFQKLFYNLFWKSSRQVISQAQDILTQWVFILFQFFLYLFFMNREIGSIKSFFGLCLLMLLGSFCCCKLSTHLSHLQSGKQMSQHLCFVVLFGISWPSKCFSRQNCGQTSVFSQYAFIASSFLNSFWLAPLDIFAFLTLNSLAK